MERRIREDRYCLNPLCIVERKSYCDNRRAKGPCLHGTIRAAEQGSRRLPIHCISWSAFGECELGKAQNDLKGLNPLYIVECFRSIRLSTIELISTSLNPLYIVECFRSIRTSMTMMKISVLIHCISWSAFGAWHRRGLINQGFQRAFFCQTF